MGWNTSLNAASSLGSAMTFTPDTGEQGTYTVVSFTAPKKAVYRFQLKGSGGSAHIIYEDGASYSGGGAGGFTTGYLLLEAGQTVYVGAGGPCSAAFVAKAMGSKLSAIAKNNLYFVAGGGGGGGAMWGQQWNMKSGPGGNGGGSSGAAGIASPGIGTGGNGGTQTGGFAYGEGGGGGYSNQDDTSRHGGRGGDGLYGGTGGTVSAGGGGGSGYVYSEKLLVGSKTYISSTGQGGGAGSNAAGSVVVTYYADAELPIVFDGVKLMELYYNGVKVEHLIYNGAALFAHKLKRGAVAAAARIQALCCKAPRIKEAFA